jgi:hypothetical protein
MLTLGLENVLDIAWSKRFSFPGFRQHHEPLHTTTLICARFRSWYWQGIYELLVSADATTLNHIDSVNFIMLRHLYKS